MLLSLCVCKPVSLCLCGVKMSVLCVIRMSGIKYRPGTSDTAENVEINQISGDKWAALTGYPGKLHFSPFLRNYFFGGNLGIILAGAAASLLGFSANGMKGWNVVNILGELVCIRYNIKSTQNLNWLERIYNFCPPSPHVCFVLQGRIVKIP